MRGKGVIFTVLLALGAGSPAPAQQAGPLAEIHFNRIKPGMTQQYEAGRKKHMAWHKSQNDAWSWYVWEVLTGDGTGSYVVGTFQHNWKDLDAREKFNAGDTLDANASMGASLASEAMSYYVYRADLSLAPEAATPAPLISVTHFMVNQEGVNDFVEAVKKIGDAIKKTNYPLAGPSRWYQLVNGGETPHFVLVGDRANWAAFQPPTMKSLDTMVEEAYGKEAGDAILATLRKAVRSTYTETLQYRPDLSYVSGK
jgi:hypothetical protein